jgi:hypothetical protein
MGSDFCVMSPTRKRRDINGEDKDFCIMYGLNRVFLGYFFGGYTKSY